MVDKKQKGQYYTITNPFNSKAFIEWFLLIPLYKRKKIIEPFAGSNNIVKMINEMGFEELSWFSYDIEPSNNNVIPDIKVIKQDTIKSFPKIDDCFTAITNPPYLAKNSATKNNFDYEYPEYDDLYKKCLEVMLDNCEYVAAIIPESFITADIFRDRLNTVISLNYKMFDDTECPVCLALFNPDKQNDFKIYRGNIFLGWNSQLTYSKPKSVFNNSWKFNDANGEIGIICIDNTKEASIQFKFGLEISNQIKSSSRNITRVSGLPQNIDLNRFIIECNKLILKYRVNTEDVFMTAFKGLRKDGKFRRRLDFKTARDIMNLACEYIQNN